jgi:hypothetical protein
MQYDSNAYSTSVQVYVAGIRTAGGSAGEGLGHLPERGSVRLSHWGVLGARDGPRGCRRGVDQRYFSLKRVFPNLTRTRTYGWAGGLRGSSDFGVQSMPSVKLLRGFDSNSPDFERLCED